MSDENFNSDDVVASAFESMKTMPVPQSGLEELMQSTSRQLRHIDASRTVTSVRSRGASGVLCLATCAAVIAIMLVGFSRFSPRPAEHQPISSKSSNSLPLEMSAAELIPTGDSVLLPLNGEPVRVSQTSITDELIQEIHQP